MKKQMNLKLENWVQEEIIGDVINKSARINELIMKGWMYEKEKSSRNEKQITKSEAEGMCTLDFWDKVNAAAVIRPS